MWLVLAARSKSLLGETASYEMHDASFHFSHHPAFRPGTPEIPSFKRFVKWWQLTDRVSFKPLNDFIDFADKMIVT